MTEPEIVETSALQAVTEAEISQAIATAKRFPRDIRRSVDRARQLATSSVEVAEECHYSLPRDGKNIEGPSVRFAEILAGCWGNCRAGARVLDTAGSEVVAQGVFVDCESNTQTFKEVRRRLTDRYGRRYSPDMIGTTANAAASVAYRNAVLAGVPKALWLPAYEAALKAIAQGGPDLSLAQRRQRALRWFEARGADAEAVLQVLDVEKVSDIGSEQLTRLTGIKNAILDESTTVEEVFGRKKDRPRQFDTQEAVRPKAIEATRAAKELETRGIVQELKTRGVDLSGVELLKKAESLTFEEHEDLLVELKELLAKAMEGEP